MDIIIHKVLLSDELPVVEAACFDPASVFEVAEVVGFDPEVAEAAGFELDPAFGAAGFDPLGEAGGGLLIVC